MDQVSVTAPQESVAPTVSVLPDPGVSPTISIEAAKDRAAKAERGLGFLGANYQDIFDNINIGKEKEIRDRFATQLTSMKMDAASSFVNDMVAKKGGPLGSADINAIHYIMGNQGVDSDSIFEQYYGKTMLDEIKNTRQRNPGNVVDQAEEQHPDFVHQLDNLSDSLLAKNLYARTVHQNMEHAVSDQSYLGRAVDVGKDLLSLGFYTDFKLRGLTPGTDFFQGGLLGSNLEEQRKELMKPGITFREFKDRFDSIIGPLKDANPAVAREFAKAIVGQTSDEQIIGDVLDGVNVVTVPGVLGGAKLAGKLGKETAQLAKNVYKDTIKASGSDPMKPSQVIEATGDLKEAAVVKNAERIVSDSKGELNPSSVALEDAPSAFKPDAVQMATGDTGSFSTTLRSRIRDRIESMGAALTNAVKVKAQVERIPVLQAGKDAARIIMEDVKNDFPGIRNNILDVDTLLKDPIFGQWSVEVKFGDATLGQWTEKETAHNWATDNGFTNFEVRQKGAGFHVVIEKNISEISDVVRDSLLKTGLVAVPEGGFIQRMIGAPLRSIRTAEDTLSVADRQNRHIAATTRSFILQQAEGEAKHIENLVRGKIATDETGESVRRSYKYGFKKERFDDWNRVVTSTKDIPDPANGGVPGYFFKNIGELEAQYRLLIGRAPDTVETNAYFAFKNLMEMDRMIRNVVVYRNKARLGTQEYTIKVMSRGRMVESPLFDAVMKREMTRDKGAVLSVGRAMSKEKAELIENIPEARYKAMQTKVKEGKALFLQVFDPDAKPLREFFKKAGDRRMQYVYVDLEAGAKHTQRDLRFNQVPRRGGFHLEPEYDHYIKQATVRLDNFGGQLRAWYEGDRTIMPVAVRAMGQDLINRMNAVRVLLHAGDHAGAEALGKKTLPFNWDEFRGRFEGKTIDGVKYHPELSTNEPFQLVSKDRRIADQSNELAKRYNYKDPKTGRDHDIFVDGTKNGSLAKQYEVPFTGERDAESLQTVVNKGTAEAPMYEMANAKFVDPAVSINRALSKVANSVFMDDYKLFAMEHWLRRAENYMRATPVELKSAPFYHFSVGGLKESFKSDVPDNIRRELMQDWQRIRQFTGYKDDATNYLEAKAQDFADALYLKGGESKALIANNMLPYVKDGPAYLRSMAFHLSMGLWSVPQLLTQLSTYSTIMSVAGWKHASSGSMAAMMTAWSKLNKNPNIIAALDRRMSEMRIPGAAAWKNGEFTESLDLMERTGFGHIAGEYALLDYHAMPSVITGQWKGFLDGGKMFFNMGERGSRYGAWHTAYREFRDVNPYVKIGNKELQEIRSRADLLNVNMTSASASALNKGVFSLPMQFLTYQLRLAELFWSKRIGDTVGERVAARARMVAWNAAIYGVPATVGLTGLPLGDTMRQAAIDHGYTPGNAYISTLINEGLMSTMAGLVTGLGDIKKGVYVNIGDKFGQGGFTPIKEVLSGDAKWYQLFGAAPQKLYDIVTSFDDEWQFAGSFMRQDQVLFKPNVQSALKILKNVTSANNGLRTYAALNTGNWISKDEDIMDTGIGAGQAIVNFIAGTQPIRAADTRNVNALRKDRDEFQKTGERNAMKEWHFGTNNMDSNPNQALIHFNNAMIELKIHGYPDEKYSSFMALVNKNKESVAKDMDWSYFMRNVDPRKKIQSFQSYDNRR